MPRSDVVGSPVHHCPAQKSTRRIIVQFRRRKTGTFDATEEYFVALAVTDLMDGRRVWALGSLYSSKSLYGLTFLHAQTIGVRNPLHILSVCI